MKKLSEAELKKRIAYWKKFDRGFIEYKRKNGIPMNSYLAEVENDAFDKYLAEHNMTFADYLADLF